MTLPAAATAEAFATVRRDEALLRPGVDAILARHRLAGAAVARFADGSLPVYAIGDARVLELYAPPYLERLPAVEVPTLDALAARGWGTGHGRP